MTTPAELLSIYTTQAQMSSFFTDKMGWINVLSYANGATINDGATDATSAIQAAVDALPSRGGFIYFPKGAYLINGTVYVPGSENNTDYMSSAGKYRRGKPVVFVGEKYEDNELIPGVLFKTTLVSNKMFRMNSTNDTTTTVYSWYTGWGFKNIAFQGVETATTIYGISCSHGIFDGCVFNVFDKAIDFSTQKAEEATQGATYNETIRFYNCKWVDIKTYIADLGTGNDDIVIEDSYIVSNSSWAYTPIGFKVRYGHGIHIRGGIYNKTNYLIEAESCSNIKLNAHFETNNVLVQCINSKNVTIETSYILLNSTQNFVNKSSGTVKNIVFYGNDIKWGNLSTTTCPSGSGFSGGLNNGEVYYLKNTMRNSSDVEITPDYITTRFCGYEKDGYQYTRMISGTVNISASATGFNNYIGLAVPNFSGQVAWVFKPSWATNVKVNSATFYSNNTELNVSFTDAAPAGGGTLTCIPILY